MLEKSEVESVQLFRYIPNEGDIYHNQVCLPDLMSRSSGVPFTETEGAKATK